MKFSRRAFLAGVCVAALVSHPASAWIRGKVPIGTGWNTLPLGCGGQVTGIDIANDGSMVCRTDVGNIYRFSGKTTDYANPAKRWMPLLTYASLGATVALGGDNGGWEHVLAPNNSNVHYAIFADMSGVAGKSWVWYSADAGETWSKSDLPFLSYTAASNAPPGNGNNTNAPMGGRVKGNSKKIAVDPINPDVAYCGVPYDVNNVLPAAYTTLNKAGGSSPIVWTPVKTSGATPIGNVGVNTTSCGIVIDPSLGTTTVGGQTVTKHVYLPAGGLDIYETFDGGDSFVSTGAATAFGSAAFWVGNAVCNVDGVYYATVLFFGAATSNSLWRYVPGVTAGSGTWTNITPASYTGGNLSTASVLICDKRSTSRKAYLSISGANGLGAGFTSTNANSGTPTWNGITGGEFPYLSATSYDVGYLNYIFGQQSSSAFVSAPGVDVDPNGLLWFCGNQGLWYSGTSNSDSAPNSNLIDYGSLPSGIYSYWWAMARGMEVTVALDSLCPPGGTYPILAQQDLGGVERGTFTTYPKQVFRTFNEYSGNSLEYAASDPSFVVACITGQVGNANSTVDSPSYSASYGADGSWNAITSAGSLYPGQAMAGGQIVAVDHDNWVRAYQGNGASTFAPCYTSNATSGAATWTLCSGLPSKNLFNATWTFGNCYKPMAVGYGSDLNTVWVLVIDIAGTTAAIYRSTDKGANFSSIISWTITAAVVGPFLLSVPGYPNELWATAQFTGGSGANYGLWHITNANTASASKTQITLPTLADLPIAISLGAPSSPGGYPMIYYVGTKSGLGGAGPKYLYQGVWNGSIVTWSLYGIAAYSAGTTYSKNDVVTYTDGKVYQSLVNSNVGNTPSTSPSQWVSVGSQNALPASCQLPGIMAIRGDWNVYGRLYVASRQSGYAYYNP